MGSLNPKTIGVKAWVCSLPITILIDSRSRHNFIDFGELQKKKKILPYNNKEIVSVRVRVANGVVVVSEGKVVDVPFSIQDRKHLPYKYKNTIYFSCFFS